MSHWKRVPAARAALALAAAAGFALAASCVPSLHALVTPAQATFEEALLGAWIESGEWTYRLATEAEEAAADLTIARDGEKGYVVAFRGDDGVIELRGLHGKVGELRFLDLSPPPRRDDLLAVHLLEAHTFWRMELAPDALALLPLKPDWIESHPSLLRHERVRDRLVLTATNAELRRVLARHADAGFERPAPPFASPAPAPARPEAPRRSRGGEGRKPGR